MRSLKLFPVVIALSVALGGVAVADQVNSTLTVSYTVSDTQISPGENITITTIVENTGNVSETTTITVYANATPINTTAVTLAGGESSSFNTTTSFSESGNVTVNQLKPTTIDVVVGGFPDYNPTDPDNDSLYEDMNGDGTANIIDVGQFLHDRNSAGVQAHINRHDFNRDGRVNIIDVGKLMAELGLR